MGSNPPIQFIQNDVRQQRRQDSALRRSLLWENPVTAGKDDRRFQHFFDDADQLFIPDSHCPYLPNQLCMADIVEEPLYVQIDYMIQMLYLNQSATLRYRCFCGTIWTETVGAFAEFRFTDRFHDLQDALLHHTVNNGGNAQRSCFAIGLGYLHTPNRPWVIFAELSPDEPDKICFA